MVNHKKKPIIKSYTQKKGVRLRRQSLVKTGRKKKEKKKKKKNQHDQMNHEGKHCMQLQVEKKRHLVIRKTVRWRRQAQYYKNIWLRLVENIQFQHDQMNLEDVLVKKKRFSGPASSGVWYKLYPAYCTCCI